MYKKQPKKKKERQLLTTLFLITNARNSKTHRSGFLSPTIVKEIKNERMKGRKKNKIEKMKSIIYVSLKNENL